ncbi:hydroxyacylglutathione hydrolase [Clostridium acetireducens DSM 10703]|uniref:Hydroxyacylglutathione hydrolase n=1 Tax=Clostridium acetireducens DSM 10703 TaxID=1121290 RepID=A0A1E8F011_9CLOT|nr:ComEC/Rec2 family competence protein [Clostridium acetireducens]OFI06727.1 hydroxyacylglutathione hydrolase [Clostridium acetireducens DSM 10703]
MHNKKSIFTKLVLFFAIVFSFTLFGCSSETSEDVSGNENVQVEEKNNYEGDLKVHFIDVGQGDSILLQQGNATMLIDAGKNDAADSVVSYLKKQNIEKLDYIVGTHPHEDHIGGMDAVIDKFNIGKVYMPKKTANTKTFRDVIKSIKAKNLKITNAKSGSSFNLGQAKCTVLAPNSGEYENTNNYSIVIKVEYGSNSFLFTGDAEALSEKEILKKGYNISSDVLKVGHHGSHSSTCNEFLNKVNPKYAVISLGKRNDYGHPHKETLSKLNSKGIQIYRTDESGTIIATANGKDITFNKNNQNTVKENTSTKQNFKNSEKSYVDSQGKGLIKGNINSKGEKIYHLPGGKYYDKTNAEAWFKTTEEAEKAGFRASKR